MKGRRQLLATLVFLMSSVSSAKTVTPECTEASRARAAHQVQCREAKAGCKNGDKGACVQHQKDCGLLADSVLLDKRVRACGPPEETEAQATEESRPAIKAGQSNPEHKRPAMPTVHADEPPRYGIDVYGRPGCSLTQQVRSQLDQAGLSHRFHDIDSDPGAKAYLHLNNQYLNDGLLPLLVVDRQPRRFDFDNVAAACGR